MPLKKLFSFHEAACSTVSQSLHYSAFENKGPNKDPLPYDLRPILKFMSNHHREAQKLISLGESVAVIFSLAGFSSYSN